MTTVCASNERQIALATSMWSQEHYGFAPGSALFGELAYNNPNTPGIGQFIWGNYPGRAGTPQTPLPGYPGWGWQANGAPLFINRGQSVLVTRGYLSTPATFVCPSDAWAPGVMSAQLPWLADAGGFVDYRFNVSVVGSATSAIFGPGNANIPTLYDNTNYYPYDTWSAFPGSNAPLPVECPKMDIAAHPSETMLLEDGVSALDFCSQTWPVPPAVTEAGKFQQIGNAVHDNFKDMNVGFIDCHVETVPQADLAAPFNDSDFINNAPEGKMAYTTFFLSH